MGFIIGAVVALIVVFLLAYITVKKPVFGEIMIGFSIVLIMASTFFYFQKDERVEKKRSLIPVEQITSSGFSHSLSYGNYYKLTSEIQNNSQRYFLRSIILNIKFFKCPDSFDTQNETRFTECEFILEKQHKIDIRLASQQTRKVESYLLLSEDKLADATNFKWKIEIISGVAR